MFPSLEALTNPFPACGGHLPPRQMSMALPHKASTRERETPGPRPASCENGRRAIRARLQQLSGDGGWNHLPLPPTGSRNSRASWVGSLRRQRHGQALDPHLAAPSPRLVNQSANQRLASAPPGVKRPAQSSPLATCRSGRMALQGWETSRSNGWAHPQMYNTGLLHRPQGRQARFGWGPRGSR